MDLSNIIHQRYKNLSPTPSFHAKQLGHEMDQLLKQGRADVMSGRNLFTDIDIDIICHSDGKPVAFHENNIVSLML